MPDKEIIFQVRESPEGGYTARAVGYGIFTQGDDWDDLIFMIRDAVLCTSRMRKRPRRFG